MKERAKREGGSGPGDGGEVLPDVERFAGGRAEEEKRGEEKYEEDGGEGEGHAASWQAVGK